MFAITSRNYKIFDYLEKYFGFKDKNFFKIINKYLKTLSQEEQNVYLKYLKNIFLTNQPNILKDLYNIFLSVNILSFNCTLETLEEIHNVWTLNENQDNYFSDFLMDKDIYRGFGWKEILIDNSEELTEFKEFIYNMNDEEFYQFKKIKFIKFSKTQIIEKALIAFYNQTILEKIFKITPQGKRNLEFLNTKTQKDYNSYELLKKLQNQTALLNKNIKNQYIENVNYLINFKNSFSIVLWLFKLLLLNCSPKLVFELVLLLKQNEEIFNYYKQQKDLNLFENYWQGAEILDIINKDYSQEKINQTQAKHIIETIKQNRYYEFTKSSYFVKKISKEQIILDILREMVSIEETKIQYKE
ncbi:hypothetical protein NPA08_00350 [Mycoplasmopsis citelli]|uniref:hypothetical protein n=1 Tax=Mycoplasmopsis citelli TaxID=171281 RepID=UPI002114CCB0|nr:hypothetical protein [Mycoplasmopsis citelli]UUD36279.1 hypothetical protein NPA08_00350 [Mycoplasmopsis citelli]